MPNWLALALGIFFGAMFVWNLLTGDLLGQPKFYPSDRKNYPQRYWRAQIVFGVCVLVLLYFGLFSN